MLLLNTVKVQHHSYRTSILSNFVANIFVSTDWVDNNKPKLNVIER